MCSYSVKAPLCESKSFITIPMRAVSTRRRKFEREGKSTCLKEGSIRGNYSKYLDCWGESERKVCNGMK